MSEYERKRLERMEQNKQLMLATGILQATKEISVVVKPRDLAAEKRRKAERKSREKPLVNPDLMRKLRTRVAKPDVLDEAVHEQVQKVVKHLYPGAADATMSKPSGEDERAKRLQQAVAACQGRRSSVMHLYRSGPETTRPFNWFVKQVSPRLRIRYPHLHQNAIMKLVGTAWKSLSTSEKMHWDLETSVLDVTRIPALAEAIVAMAVSPPQQPSSAKAVSQPQQPSSTKTPVSVPRAALTPTSRTASFSSGLGLFEGPIPTPPHHDFQTLFQTSQQPRMCSEHTAPDSHTRAHASGHREGGAGEAASNRNIPSTYTSDTNGQTLASIARMWAVDLQSLVAMNKHALPGLNHKARLKKDTVLRLPRRGHPPLHLGHPRFLSRSLFSLFSLPLSVSLSVYFLSPPPLSLSLSRSLSLSLSLALSLARARTCAATHSLTLSLSRARACARALPLTHLPSLSISLSLYHSLSFACT